MNNLVHDDSKNIAVFINDFDPSYKEALDKLSKRLNRPLKGVLLVDSELKASKANLSDDNDIFEEIVCDFGKESALRAAIKPLEDNLLLITGLVERNQPYLQKIIPHVPYILTPTERSLTWSTHKVKMRRMLKSYDRSLVPKFVRVASGSEEEIQRVLRRLKFPLIIKPTGLATSVLVSKADDEQELRKTIKSTLAVIDDIYERDRGRGKPSMIVEEFIKGDMYTVDVYVNAEGKVWSLPLIRTKTADAIGKIGFYTYQEDTHLPLNEIEINNGQTAAEKSVHALGLRSCVAHVELFYTAKGWKIIELGARPGGQRQDIYQVAYGIDHAYNELLIKVGLEPEVNIEHLGYCTVMDVYTDEEGVIEAIEGYETACKYPSAKYLDLHAKPGDQAMLSVNGGRYIIRGLLFNKDLDKLNTDTAKVRSSIKLLIAKK